MHELITASDTSMLRFERTTQELLSVLAVIDREGWDSPIGTALLRFVYEDMVRPLARSLGLEGVALDQACATGWGIAWEKLEDQRLRGAASPWGIVWTSVRRALLGELLAGRYATSARHAWSVHKRGGERERRLLSLAALEETGWDMAEPATSVSSQELGSGLAAIAAALTAAGWNQQVIADAVAHICNRPIHPLANPARMHGARTIAADLDLPLWQVLRLMRLLRGLPGWPGLLERVTRDGTGCLDEPMVRAAIQCTVDRRSPVPTHLVRPAA